MLAGIFPGNRSLSAHTAAVASTVLSTSALLFHHSAGQEEMTVKEPSGKVTFLSSCLFTIARLNLSHGHFIPLSCQFLWGMLKQVTFCEVAKTKLRYCA